MRRLTALLTTALLAAAALTGCGTTTATLTVLGPWIGGEESAFRAVLHEFEEARHVKVDYQGNPVVNQVLLADVRKGRPPDVAVLASTGELARYARSQDLRKLTGIVDLPADQYSGQWRALLQLGTSDLYAVPVKADLKSLVWYDPARLDAPVPGTWDDLLALTRDRAARATTPWCLGVEAFSTSGWPGTDWIEDILLRQAGPRVYESWAAGEQRWTSDEVRRAWQTWGELLDIQGAVHGGRSGALLTYFGDAGKPMFAASGGCLLEHQSSIAPDGFPPRERAGQDYEYFPFPGGGRSVASVNPAGQFTDNPLASELMRFLAGKDAQQTWPGLPQSSAYSVNRQVLTSGVYADPVRQRIASTLSGDELCLDASDVMPAEMSDAFYRGVLQYLADPASLDDVLSGLEKVRVGLPESEHLDVPCGS